MKVRIMVLHMGAEFQVRQKSGSPDTGSNGVKNGAFRLFLEKNRSGDPDFGAGIASYGP